MLAIGSRHAGCAQVRRPDARWLCALLLAVLTTACSGRGGAESETTANAPLLPIVRPFALDGAGQAFTSPIQIPPRQKGQASEIMIGFRVPVAAMSLASLDMLEDARVPVVVRLTRKTPAGVEVVPVFTQRYVPGEGLVPTAVGEDGIANQKSGMVDADGGALMAAGLHPQPQYREYAFVTLPAPEPGTYDLSISTLEANPDLAGIDSELLVSYTRLGK